MIIETTHQFAYGARIVGVAHLWVQGPVLVPYASGRLGRAMVNWRAEAKRCVE